MPQPPNILVRIVTGLAALAVVVAVLSVLMAAHGPTPQDARVSDQIRDEFARSAGSSLTPHTHIVVTSSARRNGTFIFVAGGSLSTEQKQRLALEAKQIGQHHDNRQVTIVFRN
jgi:hypothetical protein